MMARTVSGQAGERNRQARAHYAESFAGFRGLASDTLNQFEDRRLDLVRQVSPSFDDAPQVIGNLVLSWYTFHVH